MRASSSTGSSPSNSSPSSRLGSSSGFGPRRSSVNDKEDRRSLRVGHALSLIDETRANQPKKRAKSEAQLLTTFGRGLASSKETYGTMSAKARGEKVHNGPLELRKAREARDCTQWVRSDKQYNPYCQFEAPNNKPTPKPEKSAGPPPLWLPERAKDPKLKGAVDDLKLGAEAGEDEADNESLDAAARSAEGLKDRPPWDTEHHVMFSRMNNEVQAGCREYFDRPIRKEGDGIPKVREQYAMNDRQCGWDDTPAPLGEYRKTLYDNIGPYNRGGCKEQQMPSYWRKVKNWQAFDDLSPDLTLSGTGRPREEGRGAERQSMLTLLADTPAHKTKDFWRKWAEAVSAPGELPPPNRYDRPPGWDDRWNVCWSRANTTINQRQREYFSVPEGSNGVSTQKPRPRKSAYQLRQAAAAI